MAEKAGAGARLRSATEEKVAAGGCDDRRAGVLREHEPAQRLRPAVRKGQLALEPERQAVAPEGAVHREAAPRRERQAGAADRPLGRVELVGTAEEDIGAVAPHDLAAALRV